MKGNTVINYVWGLFGSRRGNTRCSVSDGGSWFAAKDKDVGITERFNVLTSAAEKKKESVTLRRGL